MFDGDVKPYSFTHSLTDYYAPAPIGLAHNTLTCLDAWCLYIECYTRTFIESVYFIILCIFKYVIYFFTVIFVF